MNKLQFKMIKDSEPFMAHYNHNHDKLGRFAKSVGGAIKSAKKRFQEWDESGEGKPNTFSQVEATQDMRFSPPKKKNDLGNISNTKEVKNIIPIVDDFVRKEQHKCKAFRGDTEFDLSDNAMFGESSTKVWKEHVRSNNGVNLIKTHPTNIEFRGIAHESGTGIDKSKLKQLDSFALSRDTSTAINEGRNFGTKDNSYSGNSTDWSCAYINYGFSPKGEPMIVSASYFNQDITKDNHVITVEFDTKRKPIRSTYDG